MAGVLLHGDATISRRFASDCRSNLCRVLNLTGIDAKIKYFYRKPCGFLRTAAGLRWSRVPGGFGAIETAFGLNQVLLQRDIGEFRLPGGILKRRRLQTRVTGANGSHDEDGNSKTSSNEGSDENRARTSKPASGDLNGRNNSPPQEKQSRKWWRNRKWNWKETAITKAQEIGTLFLQLGVVLFLMRFLRPGIPLLGSESRVSTSYVSVPFSEFLSRINSNHVQKVEVDGVHFTFCLKPDVVTLPENVVVLDRTASSAKRIMYTTTRPSDMKTPYERMLENEVEFGAPDRRSGGFLNSALVTLLYIALVAGLLNRFPMKFTQHSTGHLRNRKARGFNSSKAGDHGDTVMFSDVAGVDEAKEELEEIVEFLRNPDRYARLGARPPRGVLLVGLPGTGKTLLAKAVAGEADVPFISCSASEFVELYVGMGASRVRDLFARAKKDAPSIVFIDEIDAVAKSRDGRLRIVSNDEREQTLNQLLTEMDGFESNSAVIVLGATNRADVLDPALRRPGRFDRIVMVEPPDKHGRQAILQVHISKKQLPLAADVDLNVIATATTGFTGADLANLVNEAALLAGRANKLVVGKEDFMQAVERSIAGIEKKRSTLQSSEKAVVARHEVGHAIVGTAVANLLPGQPRVEKLSILPRSGGALGFTYIPPFGEDRCLLFVDELRGRLVTLLGGRAAEDVVYSGRVSTGALDDIKRATDMAYKAVAEYGLNQSIGPISLATLSGGGLDESGATVSWAKDQGHMVDLVQREVKALLQSALEMALLVIHCNPTVLNGLGAQLEGDFRMHPVPILIPAKFLMKHLAACFSVLRNLHLQFKLLCLVFHIGLSGQFLFLTANEKVEGEALQDWLKLVVAPMELAAFIKGEYMLPKKAEYKFREEAEKFDLEEGV